MTYVSISAHLRNPSKPEISIISPTATNCSSLGPPGASARTSRASSIEGTNEYTKHGTDIYPDIQRHRILPLCPHLSRYRSVVALTRTVPVRYSTKDYMVRYRTIRYGTGTGPCYRTVPLLRYGTVRYGTISELQYPGTGVRYINNK